MYTDTYTQTHSRAHTYTRTRTHLHTRTRTRSHTYTQTHSRTHTYTRARMHAYTHVHGHTYVYTYVHTNTYTRVYTHVHIRTHTRVHSLCLSLPRRDVHILHEGKGMSPTGSRVSIKNDVSYDIFTRTGTTEPSVRRPLCPGPPSDPTRPTDWSRRFRPRVSPPGLTLRVPSTVGVDRTPDRTLPFALVVTPLVFKPPV